MNLELKKKNLQNKTCEEVYELLGKIKYKAATSQYVTNLWYMIKKWKKKTIYDQARFKKKKKSTF